jgi:hypothetical protein
MAPGLNLGLAAVLGIFHEILPSDAARFAMLSGGTCLGCRDRAASSMIPPIGRQRKLLQRSIVGALLGQAVSET